MVLGKARLRRLLVSGNIRLHDDHGNDDSYWRDWLNYNRSVVIESHAHRVREVELQPEALQPASIDLRCGSQWFAPKPNTSRTRNGRVTASPSGLTNDPGAPGPQGAQCAMTYDGTKRYEQIRYPVTDTKLKVDYDEIQASEYEIPANGFVLVRTREVIGIDTQLFAKVEGRSSVGRVGVIVETAGVVDPGFYGSITLEFFNCLPNPVVVYANQRCCQLVISEVDGDTEGGYESRKYQNQIATTGSKLHLDFQSN